MKTASLQEARTHLSRLVQEASEGEPFVIAKAGKPMVTVSAFGTPVGTEAKRLGFMEGQLSVPDDFDRMGQAEIEGIFSIRK